MPAAINVTFLAPGIRLPSIETQAVRLHAALAEYQAQRTVPRIVQLPPFCAADDLLRRAVEILPDTDVLVVVKHHLFGCFGSISRDLMQAAREHGVIVVSHPCDGIEAGTTSGISPFTAEQADAVLALSTTQCRVLQQNRVARDVYQLGHASRLEDDIPRRPVRERVENIVWENPVHHNPVEAKDPERIKPYQALEELVRESCDRRGARLTIVNAWHPPQAYNTWLETLRGADVAIECKALNRCHTPSQLQKPAVKVVNYLSLGLPVVCDSLPAYEELGRDGEQLLFANTLEEWGSQLNRLFEERSLRERLSRSGYEVARSFRIENISQQLVSILQTLVNDHPARGAERQ